MDFAGALGDRIAAFTAGLAGLAPFVAALSLTIIAIA